MIKDCNVIITGKNFMTSQVVLTIKRYKEIRKQKTSQEKDKPTGCLSDFDYIKSYYKLIVIS